MDALDKLDELYNSEQIVTQICNDPQAEIDRIITQNKVNEIYKSPQSIVDEIIKQKS